MKVRIDKVVHSTIRDIEKETRVERCYRKCFPVDEFNILSLIYSDVLGSSLINLCAFENCNAVIWKHRRSKKTNQIINLETGKIHKAYIHSNKIYELDQNTYKPISDLAQNSIKQNFTSLNCLGNLNDVIIHREPDIISKRTTFDT